MRYLEIKFETWSDEPPPWWIRILKKVIPAANPDIEHYYKLTRVWWLETDNAGVPQREIGFDADMNPIVVGPIGRNYGFLIDSPVDWNGSDIDSEAAAAGFDREWEAIWPKFAHLDK